MKEYRVIKNYREDEALRKSLSRLATETFGLDFEDWYQKGYWTDAYNPYSVVTDGEVVANVSVNLTDFVCSEDEAAGQEAQRPGVRHLIQLGTVMTREKYRGQGMIRRLMEEVHRDWENRVDGIYLFANDSVLDLYPRFGFSRAQEVLHTKAVSNSREAGMVQVPMEDKKSLDRLEEIIRKSCAGSAFSLTGNSGLVMFHITKFLRNNVYYERESGVFAVAEIEDGRLLLYDVFSEKPVDLDRVIASFGKQIRQVVAGFTPRERSGFTAGKVQEEDTTLFVKGKGFEDFSSLGVRIPLLAYA